MVTGSFYYFRHHIHFSAISLCMLQDWIVRAFLVEEQKIVKKVLKLQKSKEKTAPKS
ncbi:hypothetical protein YC2023_019814 [Brassica napus]